LIAESDRLGMAVDVTLTRGKQLPDFRAHMAAVETLVTILKPFRNWYLDLGNERDVGDARYVSLAELKELGAKVRSLDSQRLITASFGGHDLSVVDIRGVLDVAGVDFLCPHRPRHRTSPDETEAATRKTILSMKEAGRIVPVHYQEPFRRGYTDWEPVATDFLSDLRGALQGGAAGWCFHNGGQRSGRDGQPRRSFDLRVERLNDQLDEEERKVVRRAKSVLMEFEKKPSRDTSGKHARVNPNPAQASVAPVVQSKMERDALKRLRAESAAELDAFFDHAETRGQLVPPSPADEPAEKLLERLQEKAT